MKNRYRIIITGKNIYKEIGLAPEDTLVRFGTGSDCEVRIRKDMFHNEMGLTFTRDEQGIWNIMCSEGLYISVDEIRKLMTLPLYHSLELTIRHQDSSSVAFHVTFLIDFDYEEKDYDRRFDISSLSTITIGEQADSNIIIKGGYIRGDRVILRRQNHMLLLQVLASQYGVYHNGTIVRGSTTIQEGDFFSIANISFCYRGNWLFTQQSNEIQSNGLKFMDATNRGSYPRFRRNTRVKWVSDTTKIEVLDPPAIPKKPKNNILTRLLPSAIMVVSSLVVGMQGGYYVLISIASAAAGMITAVIGIREAKKDYQKEFDERINKYNTYIAKKRDEIQRARVVEQDELHDKYISETKEIENLKGFSFELFDRRVEDEDFLEVRLGLGNVESERLVDYKKQERLEIEDDLQLRPQELAEQYKYLENAPIICDLKQANAVGIIGDERSCYQIFKNVLLDICARQYHSDVKMFFVAESCHAHLVRGFRMLPQAYNDVLGIYNIVSDDGSRTAIFEYLYKELTVREQNKTKMPHMLVFLYDEYEFKSHPISRFVDQAKDLGVTFIFFGKTRADILQGCRFLIEMESDTRGVLIDTEDGRKKSTFFFQSISDRDMEAMIQLMAPVYTEEISLEGTLTKSISLFEMLHVFTVEDIDLAKNWTTSKVYQSMAAPVGISKSGIIQLDLHDKAHGPHGLVAGTTGAGKSELLQTYIMSMAILYHPYEVGFVIIDFKGGGMANQFADLPHLMGTITNIDGREIERSLRSIKAELQKRQRLFKEAGVNHIDKYIIKFRSKEVKIPLPHLILIVDEFAELKADQPEFMKELISAARIGRSLGVHLILATQKPSGQVDEQIWSNSRFKLCLKVQSQQDSNEVLKSPLAAEINEPGRAYLQVGNNEIFELFQSAYSGAPEHADESNTKEFVIYELTKSGKRLPVYVQKKKNQTEGNITQLDAAINYIRAFCAKYSLRKLPNICLPSLERIIHFPAKEPMRTQENGIVAELGIYDDPDNQVQQVYSANLSNQNMMIIGSAQTGKTNLLQTIIRSIATKYSPQEVNIYILDFGSMVLKNFEGLGHVGGVVTASEDEKLKNLFKLLYTEISERKERLLSVGVSSFHAYQEAGKKDLPQIILMIDNMTVMKELYLQDDDELINLCRDGLSVGISIIIANPQMAGIGYRYLSNFACRVALFNNDSAEYSSLFEHCRESIKDIHGRALIEKDKVHLECQTFLAFAGEKEIERVRETQSFIAEINKNYRGMKAKEIPVIPDVLTEAHIAERYGSQMKSYSMVAGLDFATVSPFWMPLHQIGALALSGRDGMGKHNFLQYTVKMLARYYENQSQVFIVDGINRKLNHLKENPVVRGYEVLPERAVEVVKSIAGILKERYERIAGGDDGVLSNAPLIVLILNSIAAIEVISEDIEAMDAYLDITGRYKNMNVCVIVGDYENTMVSYNSPEILKKLRDASQFLFFDDLTNLKIVDIPLAVIRENKKALEVGECYYIRDNEVVKLKTPRCDH